MITYKDHERVLEELEQARERVEALEAERALLAASLKKADAEVERLRAVVDGDVVELDRLRAGWHQAEKERDRLRAELADTSENVDAIAEATRWPDPAECGGRPWSAVQVKMVSGVLAALRARAGEP
jgi:chromosome segregation ATPase